MAQQMDPFDFNPSVRDPQQASASSSVVMSKSSMDLSTAISHYNRLDGIKSVLNDMRLKMSAEIKHKGQAPLLCDDLYMDQLCDIITACETLQQWLPWSPMPQVKL